MGKTAWIIVGIIILLVIVGYFMYSGNDSTDQDSGSMESPTVDQATAKVIDSSVVSEEDDVELGEVIE